MGMNLPPDAPQHILDQVPEHLRPKAAGDRARKDPAKPRRVTPTVAPRLAVEVDVPLVARSEANLGGTLRARLGRKAAAKNAVRDALAALGDTISVPEGSGRFRVEIVRLGRNKLDGDNLASAMKPVRDAVARWLGIDDGDPRVAWKYRQRPAWAAGVRIRVEYRGAGS